MIGKLMQFNRRNAMSLLLAVVMLTLAATPALAWYDEGAVNGQAARHCRVISNGQAAPTVICHQVTPHHVRPVAEKPLVRPSLAKVEHIFIISQVSTEPLTQSTSDR